MNGRGWVAGVVMCAALLVSDMARAQVPPDARSAPELIAEVERLQRELARVQQTYEARLADMERRLATLEAATTPATPEGTTTPAAPPPAPPQPAPPTSAPAPGSSKVFNPDTSVITNFLGAAGDNPLSSQPSFELSEAEVSFQAVVDPYARADIFLAAGPEGLDVEEVYATFSTLPAGLLLKAGKMRAQFGKVNTLHTHALPTTDRPLVTENLVGGEEGLSDSGVSVAKLLANPLLFLEVTGEVYRGSSRVYQSDARSELVYLGRLRGYRDLTEGSNLDVGFSFANGPTQVDSFPPVDGGLRKQLMGIDATFRYRPLRRAIYKRLNLRTELIWSRQDLPVSRHVRAFGYYALGDYQFARRWYVGARADRSGRSLDGARVDKGGSVFLTYWPSEFSQIRGQYRRTSYWDDVIANEFLFQINFSIGAHGAHVF